MSIGSKLQIREGQTVRVVNPPKGFELDAPTSTSKTADAVLVFCKDRRDLEKHAAPALVAARADQISWIAYPKAGKLDTDLNRDILRTLLERESVKPVRQIALDDVWSALRFRPS